MKYVKMLGLLAVAAAALMAFAGTAAATTITSPAGTTYTSTVNASAGKTELHGSAFSVSCNKSSVSGKIEKHGAGVPASGKISSLTFGECSFPVTVLAAGTLYIHSNNVVTSTGATITVHGPFGINCEYTTNNTTVGTLTEGANAVMHIDSAAIPRTAHSAFCGSSGEWTGSYNVTTPNPLIVD